MQTAGIYFDVEDKEFFDRLGEYIGLNFPRFLRICKENEKSDFVITDYLNKRNSRNIITIKESEGDIVKYQKASGICIELVRIIYKDIDISEEQKESGTSIICITSARGGVGKTKIAISLASHAARSGRDVLYINLDPTSTCEVNLTGNPKNALTKLQYYLESENKTSGTILKELANQMEGGAFDCIVNVHPSPDCVIGSNTADKLLETAMTDSFHDLTILDLPSFLSDSLIRLLKGSTGGIILTGSEINSREKKFIEYLDSHCKGKFIVVKNQCNDVENSIPPDNNQRPGEKYEKAITSIYRGLGV